MGLNEITSFTASTKAITIAAAKADDFVVVEIVISDRCDALFKITGDVIARKNYAYFRIHI